MYSYVILCNIIYALSHNCSYGIVIYIYIYIYTCIKQVRLIVMSFACHTYEYNDWLRTPLL